MNCIHNSSGGSLRELLSRNVGQYAAASFLVGSCRLVRQEGVLEEVGTCCGRGAPAPGATCMP